MALDIYGSARHIAIQIPRGWMLLGLDVAAWSLIWLGVSIVRHVL